MNPRGITLLEVLMTVALLTMVATFLRVASVGQTQRVSDRAVELVRDADARARLVAMVGGPVDLLVEPRRCVVRRAKDNLTLFVIDLPPPAECITPGSASAWRIDGQGRSADYQVQIHAGSSRTLVRVAGLTGWVEVLEVSRS